jgi:hypothetical protein
VNATWGEPFVCDCLSSSVAQMLCGSNDTAGTNIVEILSNITTNETRTEQDVTASVELIQLIADNPGALANNQTRQVVVDTVDNLFSTPSEVAENVENMIGETTSIEQSITDGLNAVIDNIPEPEEDSEVTINSTQGNVQIVVSRPSVNTIIRSQGIQFQRPGRSVSLPTGLLMQVLGDGLGGGRATLSVTTVPSQAGTFQPESTFQVDSDQLDITLRSNGQTVVVENLNATNLVSFEVQRRKFRNGVPFCCFYNSTQRRWTSEGCMVVSQSRSSATCACSHLTFFAFLTGPSAPSTITPLGAVLISVGVVVALALIVTGIVMIVVIFYRNRAKDKPVVLSSL